MNEVFDFIKACKVYYLATTDDGQARVRPFGTINLFEGKLYIQTGKSKDVAKQLIENPNAELCCFNGKEWLRLWGRLVLDDRIEAKKDMLDHYPNLRDRYDENDDNTAVFYFDSGSKATISSFTAPVKEFDIL